MHISEFLTPSDASKDVLLAKVVADAGFTNRQRLHAFREIAPLVEDNEKIAVFGAKGQIGTKLRPLLDELYPGQVLYCDATQDTDKQILPLDVTDAGAVGTFIKANNVKAVINLAAFLSAAADKNPELAESVNLEAPKDHMRFGPQWGLRKYVVMSSIASQEHQSFRPFENEATVKAKIALQDQSPTTVHVEALGRYGSQKQVLEMQAAYYSRHRWQNKGQYEATDIQLPRLAGVLNCHVPWPANGTTEELDKLIVACAYNEVWGTRPPVTNEGKPLFNADGQYVPAVAKDTAFEMVDGISTLPETVLLLMHRDLRGRAGLPGGPGDGPVHNIGEYSVTMEEAADILHSLNARFNVRWPDPSEVDFGKAQRAGTWPTGLDTFSTEKLIGDFKVSADARRGIEAHYARVVAALRQQRLESRDQGASWSTRNGITSVSSSPNNARDSAVRSMSPVR